MKLLFLLLISSGALAQKDTIITLPMQDGKVFYQRVFQENGTKNDLFLKAKDVFLRLFPSTKDVIQNEDKDNGIVSGKGYFEMPLVMIRSTIRILVKDNKYKVEIFDFYVSSTLRNGEETPIEKNYSFAKEKKRAKNSRDSWIEFNNRVLYILDDIKNEMNKKVSTDF